MIRILTIEPSRIEGCGDGVDIGVDVDGVAVGVTLRPDHTGAMRRWGQPDHWIHCQFGLSYAVIDAIGEACEDAAASWGADA
jgi:hypothetical protein